MSADTPKAVDDQAARATAQAVVDVAKPAVEKAARTMAEEVGGTADLLVDLFAGRKTFKGILSDMLDEAFGPEPKKSESGTKPDLHVVGGADKKAQS